MKDNVRDPITVSLVEDKVDFAHTVRDFLALESDFELVGMAHEEDSFRDIVRRHLPDIALVDLGLSRPDSGVELIQWMAREYPVVRPVVLTVSEKQVLRCYQMGARGYVLKLRLETVAEVLRAVHAGKLIIPPDVGEILVRQALDQGRLLRQTQALSRLTEREKEILALIRGGLDKQEAADRLKISFFTVRRHIQNALEKSGTHSVRKLLEEFGDKLR